MLDGEHGLAVAMCMRIIVGVARANGAEKLIEIESVHADGTLYHGEAGLDFTEKLVELGGKVKVKTTTNVGSLDLLHPNLVHGDETLMAHGRRLMDASRHGHARLIKLAIVQHSAVTWLGRNQMRLPSLIRCLVHVRIAMETF